MARDNDLAWCDAPYRVEASDDHVAFDEAAIFFSSVGGQLVCRPLRLSDSSCQAPQAHVQRARLSNTSFATGSAEKTLGHPV